MGSVNLYNYDNNFELEAVPFAKGGYQATIALGNGIFYYNNVEFSRIIATSGTRKTMTIAGNGYFDDGGYFNYLGLLEAAGMGHIEGLGAANFLNWTQPPTTQRWGGSDNAINYPLFMVKAEALGNSRYSYSIAAGASSTSLLNVGIGSTAQSYMNAFHLGSFLALDTRTEAEYGGFVFGFVGYYSWYNRNTGDGQTTITIMWDTQINPNTLNGEPWTPSSGEKGFRPIGTIADKTIGGGETSNKTPTYPSDTLEQPGAPDETHASAANAGFITVYKVTEANLAKVATLLFNPTLGDKVAQMFFNPMDAIISLNIFPCSPDVGGSVTLGALGYSLYSANMGEGAYGNKIATQFKVFDFGTITIPEEWKSFLDYDATSVSLYLPFIGEVDLPATEIMGATVNVQYTIDFFTGMCVANVKIVKHVLLPDGRLANHNAQHSYQGNCAINLPLTAVNYGNMIGSFINAASSGLRTGIAGAVGSLMSDAASGGFKPTISTKGTISANAGYCSILYPYICITRPITAEPEKYQEVVGYPCYNKNRIGDCDGLCVCEDIDLTGIVGATENELRRIKQLCREGVRN